jgi:hypothetical protein
MSAARWLDWGPTPPEYLGGPQMGTDKTDKTPFCQFSQSGFGHIPNIQGSPQATTERWVSWADWKAAALNRLFREQGATGKPGRITAATACPRSDAQVKSVLAPGPGNLELEEMVCRQAT